MNKIKVVQKVFAQTYRVVRYFDSLEVAILMRYISPTFMYNIETEYIEDHTLYEGLSEMRYVVGDEICLEGECFTVRKVRVNVGEDITYYVDDKQVETQRTEETHKDYLEKFELHHRLLREVDR